MDYRAAIGPLALTRYYNSRGPQSSVVVAPGLFGDHWRTNYDRRVYAITGSTYAAAMAVRPDARVKYFTSAGAEVTHYADTPVESLASVAGGGWTYTTGRDEIETYDANGRLVTLWDKDNLQQSLTYDGQGRLAQVVDAHGRSLSFSYTGSIQTYAGGTVTATTPDGAFVYTMGGRGNNNLTTVAYPNGTNRQYTYGNLAWPAAVTGIVDENAIPYEAIDYDGSGRAIDSYLAPGIASNSIERNSFTFNGNGTTTIVDPSGNSSTLSFSNANGVLKLAGKTLCDTCGSSAAESRSYDTAGYPQSKTDFNGNITTYSYDARGLETQRVEASGTPSQRTIITVPDPTFHAPDQRSIINASGVTNGTETLTKWFYNTRGQVLYRCEIDPAVSGASSYACNSSGNAPAGVRKWSYTYCETGCPLIGLLQSVDGPRTDTTDVATYTYYSGTDLSHCTDLGGICHYNGDLQKVTNALGQSTTYSSYGKNGRVTRAQDANGVYTDMTYNTRGWLLTRTVRANANGTPNAKFDATTTFAYDNVGNVTRVTQPDGTYLHYVYDAAHRLTDIYDSAIPSNYLKGNHISYTLDAAGNRTDEQTIDPGNSLKRELGRQYSQLNRLIVLKNALSAPVQSFVDPGDPGVTYLDGYDGNGNAIYSKDGTVNHVGTEQQYDPLNRLVKTLQDHAGTGAMHDTTTQYAYDARDNLRSVIDPDTLTTSYTYDGLNNLTDLTSPDTGFTHYTPDAAGNRATQTDARGCISTYSYDVLNRLTGIGYQTTSLNVTYAYDQAATGCYNVGRLTKITDSSGNTTYCYDQRGNVLSKVQITSGTKLATGYAYTLADRLASITYPSGAIVSYTRNSVGQATNVSYKANATATPVTVISSATYLPFGPLNVLTFGNGRTLTKAYDSNYAIDQVVSSSSSASPLVIDGAVDVLGNLINASSTIAAKPPTQQYQYDPLYRLTNIQNGSGTSLLAFTYDLTGDRLSKTPQGQSAQSYTYAPATHHLASVAGVARSYDNDGNTAAVGGSSKFFSSEIFTYDDRNRLSNTVPPRDSRCLSCSQITVDYNYNGRGERVVKAVTSTDSQNHTTTKTARFVYSGSGQLLSDGDDYIYLDSTPIAYVTGGQIYYIETDQLGTPRQVIKPGATTAADTLMWKWDYFANNSAFGENTPSVQTLTFNLRFPGQYFDSETGLNYNYFRDYEAGTGRYVESDPIGLKGGISTYSYALSNSLRYADSTGLDVKLCCRDVGGPPGWWPFKKRHCYFKVDGSTYGLYPQFLWGTGDLGIPSPNDPRDKGGDCKPCNAKQPCSDPGKCIKDASDSYPVGAYGYSNHNSNTFAGSIARKCCDGGVPPGLGDTPGIGDSPPDGFHP